MNGKSEGNVLKEKATTARTRLTARGINYAIMVRKRMRVLVTDTKMMDKIFAVGHGRTVDAEITGHLVDIEAMSRGLLPVDVLHQIDVELEKKALDHAE